MTYRDYYKARHQIRKNKRTNLKLGQKVDINTHPVGVIKNNKCELKQKNKANRKIKRDALLMKLKLKKADK